MTARRPLAGAPGPLERLSRIALARTEGVGPAGYRRLLERFGSAEAALRELPALARAGGRPLRPVSLAEAAAECARAAALGARHILLGEPDYPPLLAETEDAPPLILVRGDAAAAARRCVAIVGARNASALGLRMARLLAEALARAGEVIVSGLARGIDTAAHRAALDAPGGSTVACLAGGIDIAYPPENATLQEAIAARGLLVSEMPPGTEPQARHFPRRNRLIAGLAAGVVVVEAAPGSGSLITARLAGEAGREVMAVPGHPLDPRARGCNGLLREGATLVESAADVLAALAPFRLDAVPGAGASRARLRPLSGPAGAGAEPAAAAVPEAEDPGGARPDAGAEADADPQGLGERLLALLSPAPVAVDELVRASGAPAGAVQAVLVDLELAGRLARHAGGRVSLA